MHTWCSNKLLLRSNILLQGRCVWKKVCTYKLQPSEDLTRATSLNIASLSKDRHFCVFCLSLIRKYVFLLLTALTLTMPGKKRNNQASIINCLWLWMKVYRHVLHLYSDGFMQLTTLECISLSFKCIINLTCKHLLM